MMYLILLWLGYLTYLIYVLVKKIITYNKERELEIQRKFRYYDDKLDLLLETLGPKINELKNKIELAEIDIYNLRFANKDVKHDITKCQEKLDYFLEYKLNNLETKNNLNF